MTPEQLAARFERSAKNLDSAARAGVNGAARRLAVAEEVALASATGGTLALRGTRSTKKMGVQIKPSTAAANYAALVRGVPPGLWSWLESGTKAHVVGAGRERKRGGARQALSIASTRNGRTVVVDAAGRTRRKFKRMRIEGGTNTGWATGPFVAGGSPAKRTFSKTVELFAPAIPKIVAAETHKALTKVFG